MSSLTACQNSFTGFLTGLRSTVTKTLLNGTLNGTQALSIHGAITGTNITCSSLTLDIANNETITLITVTNDTTSLKYISVVTSLNKTFTRGNYAATQTN